MEDNKIDQRTSDISKLSVHGKNNHKTFQEDIRKKVAVSLNISTGQPVKGENMMKSVSEDGENNNQDEENKNYSYYDFENS